ncbi:hypothetical protein LTR94_036210, partial [Friedmanniomyces endolithicus]
DGLERLCPEGRLLGPALGRPGAVGRALFRGGLQPGLGGLCDRAERRRSHARRLPRRRGRDGRHRGQRRLRPRHAQPERLQQGPRRRRLRRGPA